MSHVAFRQTSYQQLVKVNNMQFSGELGLSALPSGTLTRGIHVNVYLCALILHFLLHFSRICN